MGRDGGCLLGVCEDVRGGGVGDEAQVCAVPGDHDARASEVGAEGGGLAVSGKRVEGDCCGAFHALKSVGGADEQVGMVAQVCADGCGLRYVRDDDGKVCGRHGAGVVGVRQGGSDEGVGAVGDGGNECGVCGACGGRDGVVGDLGDDVAVLGDVLGGVAWR